LSLLERQLIRLEPFDKSLASELGARARRVRRGSCLDVSKALSEDEPPCDGIQ
jgi:hypothetical protein